MGTRDEFDEITAGLGDTLGSALIDEVHEILTELLRLTIEWVREGSPTAHPSYPGLHPVRFIAEIPDETLVLCYGECAAMFGDANRRVRWTKRPSAIRQLELLSRAVKLLKIETVQRLEKT